MRAKGWILFAAMAALVMAGVTAAGAAEKPGKPLNIKPSAASQPSGDNWRERAMKARAEFAPGDTAPAGGNARAIDERGDRRDGEEAGSGRLREDRGEGSSE
jgi:hypothetical protein